MPEAQAKGMVKAFHSALVQAFARFAKVELAALRSEMRQGFKDLESRINRSMLQMLIAFATLQILSLGILARILS